MISLNWPAGPDCVDRHGCLSTNILKVSRYEVPHPLNSCVLGVSEAFAYCHVKKTLQRFQLPQVYSYLMCPILMILILSSATWNCIVNFCVNTYENIILLPVFSGQDTDSLSSQQVIQLKPKQEVGGHPLGPASLVLSPHHLWLASLGRDGQLSIRETASMVAHFILFNFSLVNFFIVCGVYYNSAAAPTGATHWAAVSFMRCWWSWECVLLCRQPNTPHRWP